MPRSFNMKRRVQNVFIVIMLLLFTLHILFGMMNIGRQSSVMAGDGRGYLSDSYVAARFASDNNPYRYDEDEPEDFMRNYLPLSYLIFYAQCLLINDTELPSDGTIIIDA